MSAGALRMYAQECRSIAERDAGLRSVLIMCALQAERLAAQMQPADDEAEVVIDTMGNRSILVSRGDGSRGPAGTLGDAQWQVGWPTLSQVEAASDDAVQLLSWNRSLATAETEDQREIIAKVVQYLAPAFRKAEKD